MGRVALLFGALCLGTGCFSPSEEGKARLAALKAEGKAMDERLDTVEERFLGNQAKLQLWRELAARHQSVSAIACKSADSHLTAMVKSIEKQQDKARRLRRRRSARSPAVLSRADLSVSRQRQN